MSAPFGSAVIPPDPVPASVKQDDGHAAGDFVARAHPERVRACLDPRVSLATARRLQDCRRLRHRLHAVMAERYGSLDVQNSATVSATSDAAAALASILASTDPIEAARLAGALWHARSLKLVLSGPAVAGLVAQIGRRAHAFGLRNAQAAVDATPITDPVALASAIERDGLLCLGACASGSPALRLRLAVMLAPGTPVDADHLPASFLTNAPAVLARVAAELDDGRHDG